MFRDGPIPAAFHGVLQYALGFFLILGPFLTNFDKPSATTISIILGVVVLLIAAAADTPTGFSKRIPEAVVVMLSLGLGVLLLAAPFMFGFNEASRPTVVFLALGAAQILVTLATRFRDRPARDA